MNNEMDEMLDQFERILPRVSEMAALSCIQFYTHLSRQFGHEDAMRLVEANVASGGAFKVNGGN